MKQKHLKTRTLSLLLVFSMVIGLFSELTVGPKDARAADSQGKIILGTPSAPVTENNEKYYTFDNVNVDYPDDQVAFQYLTITVDSGYFQISSDASRGIMNQGLGLAYGSSMDQNYEEELQPSTKYEAAYFSMIDPQPDKEGLTDFIKAIHFTTEPGQEQEVSITATTVGDRVPDKLELDWISNPDQYPTLKFFNGHYYAFVPFNSDDRSWEEAYRQSKTIEISPGSGIYGYLATVTSKAEDRFIVNEFSSNGYSPDMGWIGCTRAKLAVGSKYYDFDDSNTITKWKQLDRFDSDTCKENFVWRWVSGPEALSSDNRIGYQNHAYGDGHNYWPHDGGFVVDEGKFENWEHEGNIEPNGGGYTDEAYGYYGRYASGRWNDAKNIGGYEYGIFGYYIEFGGMNVSPYYEDDKNFENLGQTTISGSSNDAKDITNATAAPAVPLEGKPVIKNQNTDKDGNGINEVGTVLVADITGVTPEDSHNTLTYQWYIQNDNGSKTPIPGATDQNFTLTQNTLNKKLVVDVTGDGTKYDGTLASDPYDTTATTKAEKIPIAGSLLIVNETTDDDGRAINKEGSVYTADLKNVTPVGCHDHLTYQWYYADYYDYPEIDGKIVPTPHLVPINGATDKSYTMTTDVLGRMAPIEYDEYGNPVQDENGNPTTVNKVHLYVKANAKADSNYTGEVASKPYDATRTNAGVTVGDNSNIPQAVKDKLKPGERVIIINPTQVETIYGVKDENGNLINDDLLANHKVWHGPDGSEEFTSQTDYTGFDGYFDPDQSDTLYIIVDEDKNYIIHEVKRPKTTQESNTDVISAEIPDSSITTVPDNKNTENTADDTISIIIDPAKPDYKYAVLQKVDGKYVPVSVKKDTNGNYIPDPTGTKTWSDGKENKVVFADLPATGTYKIVAVSTSDAINDLINDLNQPLTPDQITGGSKDIHETVPPYNPFTKEEIDAAAAFVKEHATGPDGKVVTEITDITRDIITSGETEWNKMTDNEKAAVNTKLKELGCPYTYEELLKMAKSYKIPGFKLKKVMKKKSKSQLKMVKCKGATIVCTSTNKKVATVSKKGVISAKKVGKATLTITATKGKYTNRVVLNIVVKKKFKNAKELKKFKSSKIKTPTILVARQRKLKQKQKLSVYDLEKGSKVQYKVLINKKVIKMTKSGKYTARKKGSTLVRATVKQNKKKYILYAYVTVHK